MRRLAVWAAVCAAISTFALQASGQVSDRIGGVTRDSVITQTDPRALSEIEAVPVQQGDLIETTGHYRDPQRFEQCTSTCRMVDGNRETTTVCRPFIASTEPDIAAARVREPVGAAPITASSRLGETGQARVTPRRLYRFRTDGQIEIEAEIDGCRELRMPVAMSTVIAQPRSPYCWISALTYCRYNPQGKVGYPCNCGNKAGYFN